VGIRRCSSTITAVLPTPQKTCDQGPVDRGAAASIYLSVFGPAGFFQRIIWCRAPGPVKISRGGVRDLPSRKWIRRPRVIRRTQMKTAVALVKTLQGNQVAHVEVAQRSA